MEGSLLRSWRPQAPRHAANEQPGGRRGGLVCGCAAGAEPGGACRERRRQAQQQARACSRRLSGRAAQTSRHRPAPGGGGLGGETGWAGGRAAGRLGVPSARSAPSGPRPTLHRVLCLQRRAASRLARLCRLARLPWRGANSAPPSFVLHATPHPPTHLDHALQALLGHGRSGAKGVEVPRHGVHRRVRVAVAGLAAEGGVAAGGAGGPTRGAQGGVDALLQVRGGRAAPGALCDLGTQCGCAGHARPCQHRGPSAHQHGATSRRRPWPARAPSPHRR